MTRLVDLYKSKLLSYFGYRTAALYHATDTALKPVDAVQERFLRKLGCTDLEALMVFNLAPLSARRDIAMLGVIHRTVLGKGPEHFKQFFFATAKTQSTHWTRQATRRHGRQLEDPRKGFSLNSLGGQP